MHPASCFVTLTYRRFDHPWNLESRELQLFLKRLRRKIGRKLRYYAAAEYGAQMGRAHWHLALFGLEVTRQKEIAECWPYGFVHVGELTARSAAYIVKYVTKVQVGKKEFSRMSLRPGIGADGIEATVAALVERGGSSALSELGDVPAEVRIEGKRYPMGRYLRQRVRDGVGWDKAAPGEAQRALRIKKQVEDIKVEEGRRVSSARSARARIEISDSKRRFK